MQSLENSETFIVIDPETHFVVGCEELQTIRLMTIFENKTRRQIEPPVASIALSFWPTCESHLERGTPCQSRLMSPPFSSIQNQTFQDVIKRVRSNVSERDWKLFWRIAVDGQSAADAAKEVGITANAARLVKMRILKRLRKQLANG